MRFSKDWPKISPSLSVDDHSCIHTILIYTDIDSRWLDPNIRHSVNKVSCNSHRCSSHRTDRWIRRGMSIGWNDCWFDRDHRSDKGCCSLLSGIDRWLLRNRCLDIGMNIDIQRFDWCPNISHGFDMVGTCRGSAGSRNVCPWTSSTHIDICTDRSLVGKYRCSDRDSWRKDWDVLHSTSSDMLVGIDKWNYSVGRDMFRYGSRADWRTDRCQSSNRDPSDQVDSNSDSSWRSTRSRCLHCDRDMAASSDPEHGSDSTSMEWCLVERRFITWILNGRRPFSLADD